MKNIHQDGAIRECTGCGICASVCSKNAISIKHDINGFYKPIVNSELCIDCGICKNSCYKFDSNFKLDDSVKYCLAATNNDITQLECSSSGGVSRLLMEEAISRGYKVFGCAYDMKTGIAKSVIVSSISELDIFYGSKYFQSYTYDGFSEILNDKSNQKYALFGTPCQIYAFSKTKKYISNPDLYLCVDIFCHGCPSYNLWSSYLKSIKSKFNIKSIDKIAFRSKTYGWHEYSIDFYFDNCQKSSKKIFDPFFDMFFGGDIMNKACYDCKARSTLHYADIRIGDFWGSKYELDTKGVSAIVVKSELGDCFIQSIKEKINFEHADFETIVSAQSYGKGFSYNEKRRSFLLDSLSSSLDTFELNKKYRGMFPLSRRIKMNLKAFVKMLPQPISVVTRNFLHSL